MVPTLSIVFMGINMIIGIIIPVVLLVYFKKKYNCSIVPFIMGVAVFIVFVTVLEALMHQVVLTMLPIGAVIQGNIWLYALYGGLAAGIFEETGRLLAMKFTMKKEYDNDYNALMYGAGHGGFEVFMMLTVTFGIYIMYSVLNNAGQMSLILNDSVPQEAVDQMNVLMDSLINTSPYLYMVSPLERVAAVTLHIALSVLVWTAVTRPGKKLYYFVAVFFHFAVDAVAVVMSGYGVNTLLIELAVYVMTAVVVLVAFSVWKKSKVIASN